MQAEGTSATKISWRNVDLRIFLTSFRIIFYPDAFLSLWMHGSFYAVDYTLAAAVSDIFTNTYDFNVLYTGLAFLPRGVGIVMGGYCNSRLLDYNYKVTARKHNQPTDRVSGDNLRDFPRERARSRGTYYLIIILTGTLLAYGWTVQHGKHFSIPFTRQRPQALWPGDPSTIRDPEPEQLCRKLARLHRESTSPTGMFGFHITTCRGNVPLYVPWEKSWTVFYSNLLSCALPRDTLVNGPWADINRLATHACESVIPRLLTPLVSNGRSIKPSLIHDDMWEEITGTSPVTGNIYLFDAAVSMRIASWSWGIGGARLIAFMMRFIRGRAFSITRRMSRCGNGTIGIGSTLCFMMCCFR
ncbi:hypothetical protein BDW69DRAFT_185629 [Aspergillus filifer]